MVFSGGEIPFIKVLGFAYKGPFWTMKNDSHFFCFFLSKVGLVCLIHILYYK